MMKRIVAALALCLFAGFATATFVDVASAAEKKSTKAMDKNKATKRGVKGALAESKDKEGPSSLQIGVGVGSVFVAYAVVKWL